jgi:hypothetical protein
MLGSSRIDPPSLIRDGPTSGVDIWSQADRKKASLNYAASATSSGYFVQLYNRTHKSAVFDWIDVGNSLNVCITSPDTSNPGCIPANKNFNLLTNSVYQWKVQGYNFEITSPIGSTNGFTVQ